MARHGLPELAPRRLAAVLGLPVAYFYAEDDELARLIREFQLQPKGKGKPAR